MSKILFYVILRYCDEMYLADLIIDRIEKQHSISFRDYMDMVLYHPDFGYFTSSVNTIGKRGDFFTSPYISPAFGAMIGRQISEFRKQITGDFTIIEYGAGNGMLCGDILDYLEKNDEKFESVRYIIIEKSPVLRKISQKYLADRAIWIDDVSELGTVDGCVISNELFDNLPVHKLINHNGQFMEVFVDYQQGFTEILKPATADIVNILDGNHVDFPDEFCTEVCMDAGEWFKDISGVLNRGYVLTIDYGCLPEEMLQRHQSDGTIRCYYKHQVNFDPYRRPGEQDITSDVNFSSLCYWGAKNGFQFTGYVNQNHFLRALGIVPYLSDLNDSNENKMYACTTLLERMGKMFKVLIQQKNLSPVPLSGLAFQQPVERRMCMAI